MAVPRLGAAVLNRRQTASEAPAATPDDGGGGSSSSGGGGGGEGGGLWPPGPLLCGGVVAVTATASVILYNYLTTGTVAGTKEVDVTILPIDEDVFDKHDNLFVFFLDDAGDMEARHAEIQQVTRDLKADRDLFRLRFYHNIRKEGDPAVPDGEGEAQQGPGGMPPLRVVMYKGQRKKVLRIGTETPVADIKAFFTPLSEALQPHHHELVVPLVSNANFKEKVLDASSPDKPILLQMYEDTCFLCFLMRPFVNSVAAILKESNSGLQIKRFNLEKNDFPDGCPVARGTPTFVLFRGARGNPDKWEEFKPKDLCEKLSKEFPKFGERFFEDLDEMQGMVSRRFQLFTQKVMWIVELQKIEKLHSDSFLPAVPGSADNDGQDEQAFGTIVSAMMAKDMKRTDGIRENMEHLQAEVGDAEHDAVILGTMLAARVEARERAAGAAV